MRWLEEEVTRITGKNDQMMKENLLLRHVLEEQAGKINELVRRDENRRNKKLKDEVKTEPVETEIKKSKKTVWRPGFDDDKEDAATVISSVPTVSAVSGVTPVAPTSANNDLQLRLNLPTLPTVTPTPTPQTASTLPYAAMLEQVNNWL